MVAGLSRFFAVNASVLFAYVSAYAPGPRPAGLAANAPSAASQQLKGSTDPVFAAASCIWGLCGQSILIFRLDRALEPGALIAPVRFDEREVETQHGWDIEAPATARVGKPLCPI